MLKNSLKYNFIKFKSKDKTIKLQKKDFFSTFTLIFDFYKEDADDFYIYKPFFEDDINNFFYYNDKFKLWLSNYYEDSFLDLFSNLQYLLKKDLSEEWLIKKIKVKNSKKNHRSHYLHKNKTLFSDLLNIMLRGGKKNKYFLYLSQSLKPFYDRLIKLDDIWINYYPYYLTIQDLSTRQKLFYNLNYLILFMQQYLSHVFITEVVKVPKKLKKKFNIKYTFKPKYLKLKKRLNYMLKRITLYANGFPHYRYTDRSHLAIMHTLLFWKKCYLYKSKIQSYKSVLSIYKTKK